MRYLVTIDETHVFEATANTDIALKMKANKYIEKHGLDEDVDVTWEEIVKEVFDES